MIRILKASAGSGKTFHLAKTYIRLLLMSEERHAYRHILAVTFTNKATDEMKSRILKELDILAREPEKSDYYEEFRKEFGSAEKLRARAGELLVDMLHDYGAFAVSTIDRFFQRTLKAFAREIGQFASYQVELDKQSLVHESVDRILDALTEENKEMLNWLTDSVMDQLEQGGRYSLESRLYEMAEALKSDEHREVVRQAGIDEKKAYSKENLLAVRKGCRKVMQQFTETVKEHASAALDVLSAAGVDPADTNRGFLAKLESYARLTLKDAPAAPTASWISNARNPQKWFPKKNAAALPRVQGALEGPLNAFCDLFDMPWKVYNTASILAGQIYSLGIAGELYREFDALVREKNVMSLDDSNVILSRIIGGSDAPFVYEKLGVRFEDFLLDEFQDTSTVQWSNFRPLLEESDAGGRENLIVGDVKQSIYRWRGSDWKLLDSGVKQEFPRADDGEPLTQNWRSCRAVVEFNNGFFQFAADRLDRQYGKGKGLISKIYGDVAQVPRTKETAPGHVQVTFCESKDEEPQAVLASVRAAREAGADYEHIAVLVRNNDSGSDIAGFLVDNGVPVISDDSLRVKSSVTVRRLVSLLSHVENRSDDVSGYLASSLDIAVPDSYHSLVDLAEELLRGLRRMDGTLFDGEILYIQSFMDELQDWVTGHGNNLASFLKAWSDADPKISSPAGTDAVRVMTIHKSKGLEFPYVIFPYAESVGLLRPQTRWSRPELKGTPLEGFADGAYRVKLSKDTCNTLFADDFEQERLFQYIDNINTFYVAMTRPEKELHVIAARPSAKCVGACMENDESYEFADFSQLLYWYVQHRGEDRTEPRDVWEEGEPFDFRTLPRKVRTEGLTAGYPSYPLNPGPGDAAEDVRERGRLKFSADSVDFFREDAAVRSPRLKGLVLHAILSETVVPEDLDKAVEMAVMRGACDAEQAGRYRTFLTDKIAGVSGRGWFPEDPAMVRNERPILGTDGREYRPDRVVSTPEGTMVIDFKFGEPEAAHRSQVRRYVSLYEAMGHGPVRGWLWYLREEGPDIVEEV